MEIPNGTICLFRVVEAELIPNAHGTGRWEIRCRAVEWPPEYDLVKDSLSRDGKGFWVSKVKLEGLSVAGKGPKEVGEKDLVGQMFYARVERRHTYHKVSHLSVREMGAKGGLWPLTSRPEGVAKPPVGGA